jgi:manganese oxidase
MKNTFKVLIALVTAIFGFGIGKQAFAADITTTRTYYIAAEEVDWDYAPLNRDETMGQEFNEEQEGYVVPGHSRIGRIYRKARYVAYLDKDFKNRDLSADPANGLLGPIVHAEVGDNIVINFRNNTSIPVSVHPHGVFYLKDAEGSMTNDGSSAAEMADDHVAPGGAHVYKWSVPERAGPGPSDPSSIVWLYHSHVDEVKDTNTGLFGAIVVTRRGAADINGKPADVDREEFSLFTVLNENQSLFLDSMVAKLTKKPNLEDEEFVESNLMHSINGYIFGNQPMQKMKVGEHVRWYVMALGTEVDLHTPHWHGNTVLVAGHRTDVVELLPASMLVADMVPDNPGIWMYHCHVTDHIAAGMTERYEVVK